MRLVRLAVVVSVSMFAADAIAAPRAPRAPRELSDRDEEAVPEPVADAVALVKAGKPQSASFALAELLADGAYPAHETRLRYHLALALDELRLPHSAVHELRAVVKKGPDDPWFTPALARLSALAQDQDDDAELARVAASLPEDRVPAGARDQFAYLRGVRAYEAGDLAGAQAELAAVDGDSPYAARARYLSAVAAKQRGKERSALRDFTALAQTEAADPAGTRIRDLSTLNVARVYYGAGRFAEAEGWYGQVPRRSAYWSEGVFESAWASFGAGDLDRTLGQLLTLQAPSVADATFAPESGMLAALTWFELCDWSAVRAEVKSFEGRYRPVHAELADVLRRYGTAEGKALAGEAYDRYFAANAPPTELPKAFFVHALRDQDLAAVVAHLEALDAEEAIVRAQKPAWRDVLGDSLLERMEADRERLRRRGGLALLGRMAEAATALGGLLDQAEVLKFELADRRRVELGELASRPEDLTKTSTREEIPFALSTELVYWPFNGEFWDDELGSYRYATTSRCDAEPVPG